MRRDLLVAMQKEFLDMYPMGFNDPEMQKIGKKHNVGRMTELSQEYFAKDAFGFPDEIIENMIKVVSRSSMVSLFEKPKYRDYLRSITEDKKEQLVNALYECLHGNQKKGFNEMLEILVEGKLGKWSLMTIILFYYSPETEVFCKPTTVKNIVRVFELEDLVYKPRPSYAFYTEFRKQLIEMREMSDPTFGTNNAAFSGFLMMMMPK